MIDPTALVSWVEPPDEIWFTTVADAIEIAKATAASSGFIYPSDQAALDDFIIVHWAELIL